MPAMKYLGFYLDRGCVVIPGYGRTKNTRKGCGGWTLVDTQRNTDMLTKNAKVRNGTGGLLIVDIDPKNGGSIESLRQRFPDLPETRIVRTVTQHPNGLGVHLIFTIPEDVAVATNRALGTGIDVPDAVMLPGSQVKCDDGVIRAYELVRDVEPAPAPLALIAAVDRGQESEQTASVGPDYSDELIDSLVDRFAASAPGERNAVYNQVAFPVLRARGAAGVDMLRGAYPGDHDRWIEQALVSTMRALGLQALPTSRLTSRYVDEALQLTTDGIRYGKWGHSSDRRVMFAVASICSSLGSMTTPAVSLRSLALATGIETKTVGIAVGRLIESGRLHVVETIDEGSRKYAPKLGEMTTVVSKGSTPHRGLMVNPLHDVWLGIGLTGRASHVFDLVDVGIRKASQVAAAGGMGDGTARDALKALVDVGLLAKHGTAYTVRDDVVETADRLAVELGGAEKRTKLADRIRTERARPRGDAMQSPIDAAPDLGADLIELIRHQEGEEELMRQLGLL
ncbi:Bifunctional DNA primase/polymerase%2C N-terminal [Mycobacteroides abscessus]|nr:Bifunctional DNA primase/polymerase%2C N-terminal [Mycobacteroides abscessus]CPW46195.1 Bifunctional DNA primase/polymerase%2C N-terminal [Mycobacteroides abscessus]